MKGRGPAGGRTKQGERGPAGPLAVGVPRGSVLGVVAMVAAAAFVLLTVTVTKGNPAHAADQWLHAWLQRHRSPRLTSMALAVTFTGSSTVVTPLVLAVTWATGTQTALRRLARALLAAGVLALGIAVRLVISEVVARPRPPRSDWAGYAHGYAFPSGHTAAAAMSAGLMIWAVTTRLTGHTRVAATTAVALWGVAVGTTRAYLGVHWPTDVLGSWLFAVAWLCTVGVVGRSRRRRRPDQPGAASEPVSGSS